MRRYNVNYRRNISPAEEALEMYRYWEDKYLLLMMICVDGNQRIETLIDRAKEKSEYWLNKYNALTVVTC